MTKTHTQSLKQAGTDQGAFQVAFAAMIADRTVKLAQAVEIAREFMGWATAQFRTKKAAFEAIQETFIERARFENKLKAVA